MCFNKYILRIGYYSDMSDLILDHNIVEGLQQYPLCGNQQMYGHLLNIGHRVEQTRIRDSQRRVDPCGTEQTTVLCARSFIIISFRWTSCITTLNVYITTWLCALVHVTYYSKYGVKHKVCVLLRHNQSETVVDLFTSAVRDTG